VLKSLGIEVLRFDDPWPLDEEERAVLRGELDEYFKSATEHNPIVIIIDECQASYGDTVLWNTYLKPWAGHPNPFFSVLIACAWDNSTPQHMTKGPYTPITLNNLQRVELRRTPEVPLGLLFDYEEMEELYASAVHYKTIPPLDEDLKNAIFFWSSGYASVVVAFIQMLKSKVSEVSV
jgi:hypothetical protein